MNEKAIKFWLISLSCLMATTSSYGGEWFGDFSPEEEEMLPFDPAVIDPDLESDYQEILSRMRKFLGITEPEKENISQKKVSFDPIFIEKEGKKQREKKYNRLNRKIKESIKSWDAFVAPTRNASKAPDYVKAKNFVLIFALKLKYIVRLLREADSVLLASIKKEMSFGVFIKIITGNKYPLSLVSAWLKDDQLKVDLAYLLENFNK